MNKYPLVSVIIPLYVISDRFFSDFRKFEKLKYPRFEILVVCDKKISLPKLKNVDVRLLLSGLKKTGPAEKRDIALNKAKGEICAFIDDDAYPDPYWLKNGVEELLSDKIVAVGGSGLTPNEDPYLAKLGGSVYESIFVSGGFRERFILISKKKKIRDWPAYNFMVKTSVLKKVKGWGSNFYGGEDTFLCLKLLKQGEIIYSPKVIVYHHRRALFVSHLRQIYNVSIHRGFFAKVFPDTSRLPIYFVPTLLDIYILLLILFSFFYTKLFFLSLLQFGLAFIIAYFSVFKSAGIIGSILAALGVLSTHMVYGVGFVKGFLTKKMTT